MADDHGLDALCALIGHSPRNPDLFVDALTHGSHGAKGAGRGGKTARDYQRLEFLGDRVLGLTIAGMLYQRFPQESEGALSARLNGLVTGAVCADVARAIGLPPLVRMGKQARDDGGRDSDNILGDVTEALIGALYLDGGLPVAEQFIVTHWAQRIDAVRVAPKHPKSALMEWAAAHKRRPPEYSVANREGPDHAPRFTVIASIPNAGEATATGTSKQDAEKAAALALLTQLEKRS
ncbi:MAG: ribonuclease III [Sphingopyxis sp.]